MALKNAKTIMHKFIVKPTHEKKEGNTWLLLQNMKIVCDTSKELNMENYWISKGSICNYF